MGNEVDEDLIEATIRRVAEAQAARARAGAVPEGEDESQVRDAPAAEAATADEDAIEATIQRVAAANAARLQAEERPGDAGPYTPAAAPDEDDPIEATIRRVAAERAARAAEQAAAAASSDPVHEAIAHAEATVEQDVDEETSVQEAPLLHLVPQTAPIAVEDEDPSPLANVDPGAAPAYRRPRLVENPPAAWAAPEAASGDVDALRVELRSVMSQIEDLTARVHTLAAKIAGVADDGRGVPAAGTVFGPETGPALDDDWDDTPQLPRIALGGPPRPAIMRDPSPMTATAQHLVEDTPAVRDESRPAPLAERAAQPARTEPAFAPQPIAPQPSPEAKRGFDLLPKTYRITVEDKRRGVDLVPLHRALLGMDGVKDMSLLSYSNGVAIVAVETANGIDPDALNSSVSRAMARAVKVEVHNDTTMVVKVAED